MSGIRAAGCSTASACNTDTTPTQPHRNAKTHRTKNNTTNVVIQQNSHKILMMDILMSGTCWAHKKWNKIASDIKLVFYSSTMLCCIYMLMYVFYRCGNTLSFPKPRGHGSRRSLRDPALCNIVCAEQNLTSMWGFLSHNRFKAWCVFSKLKFFAATIQSEDSSQAPQPQLSFFENIAIGFHLQAGLWYFHTAFLVYDGRVDNGVLRIHNLQARDINLCSKWQSLS